MTESKRACIGRAFAKCGFSNRTANQHLLTPKPTFERGAASVIQCSKQSFGPFWMQDCLADLASAALIDQDLLAGFFKRLNGNNSDQSKLEGLSF